MIEWNFSRKNDQSRELADSITDSKFNINPFGSFTREIIQNSLDVLDSENYKCVKVVFEYKKLRLNEIPGGKQLKEIISRCKESTNHQETVTKYEKALKILNSDEITCLKVSDYHTKGMNSDGWDALINKVGSSYKTNDTSAGRHGIGKKASFLMSLCNTVFYASKYINNEIRVGGKSMLTDWKDINDVWYSSKGWYGEVIQNDDSTRVDPIMIEDNLINQFFIRKDEYGTDIIIIALIEDDDMEKNIINSVLENFYIGIQEEKLEVIVNNITINNKTIDSVINNNYDTNFIKKGLGSDNIVLGLLKDYDLAYKKGVKKSITIQEPRGIIDIYLTLDNNENRKYYSFYREHGMKIRDYYLNTDKSFAAIVVVKGKELNDFLLKIENAAHDDFIVDKNSENYKNINETLKKIISEIENNIKNMTKLEISDSFLLEALNDMITYYGDLSKKKKNRNQSKPKQNEIKAIIQHKSNKKTVEEWTKEHKPFDVLTTEDSNEHNIQNHNPRPLPIQHELDDNTLNNQNLVYEVSYEKFFVVIQKNYIIKFNFQVALKNVRLSLIAKNVDGSMNDVTDMIESINIPNLKYKLDKNYVYIDYIPSKKDIQINVSLKNNSRYKLFAKLQGVEDESNI